jgi:hypothetical protein
MNRLALRALQLIQYCRIPQQWYATSESHDLSNGDAVLAQIKTETADVGLIPGLGDGANEGLPPWLESVPPADT